MERELCWISRVARLRTGEEKEKSMPEFHKIEEEHNKHLFMNLELRFSNVLLMKLYKD